MMNSTASKQSRKKPKGRTFQCTGYLDCNMTFTRSEHLARHIRKHTGERPFECVHCTRKFSRLDNLRQHKQTVHAHEASSEPNTLKPLSPLGPGFPRGMEIHHQPQTLPQQLQQHVRHQLQQQQRVQQQQGQPQPQMIQQKPLPPLPQQEIVQQGSNLPAAQTLFRPGQFRSKHRPSPLDLGGRKSTYNDAPYTAPTPRSAGSGFFALTPMAHPGAYNHMNPPSSALPGVQFLTNGSKNGGDSLVSPYHSSFGSVHSASNTPIASTFDPHSISTPTNLAFGSQDYKTPVHPQDSGSHSIGNGANRRSWLNNVLNNSYDSSISPTSSISLPSPNHQLLMQNKENEANGDKKVRIESLLNAGAAATTVTAAASPDAADKVKLPHVDKLGINLVYKQ